MSNSSVGECIRRPCLSQGLAKGRKNAIISKESVVGSQQLPFLLELAEVLAELVQANHLHKSWDRVSGQIVFHDLGVLL